MNVDRRRRLLVTASLAALVATAAAPAAADTTTRPPRQDAQLAIVKARAHAEVDRRETALTALNTRVSAATRLDPGHKTTLQGQISTAASGLQSVDAKVQADTDVAAARADAQTIVTGYRVFVLVEPRTHIVIAADIEASAVDRLTSVAGSIDAAIAKAQAAGKDVTKAKAAVADLRLQLTTAKGSSSSATGSVIGLTADGYPANKPTLVTARDSLKTARAALDKAVADARAAVIALA